MKKRFILLIDDFSDNTHNLIKYACDWSEQSRAELLLLHQSIVVKPAFADNEDKQQIIQQANDGALLKLKTIAKEFIPSAIKVSFVVSESHLQLTFSKLLVEPFQNLIFIGLQETGLLQQLFFSSIAIQAINNIKNIIVAKPKEISTFSCEKLFVAVTEKHPLNILELNNFLNFIDRGNSCITFFYLAKPNENTVTIEKQLKELSTLFADKATTQTAIYESHDPFENIKKIINNKEEELLIVQKGSRLLMDQLFRRFLINELIHEGQTPLIVLP